MCTYHFIGTFLTVFSLNNGTVSREKIQYYLEMGLNARKPVFGVHKQQSRRPACSSAQSDQRLCYSHFGKYPD